MARQQRHDAATAGRRDEPLSDDLQSSLDDSDMQAAPRALLRAAVRAREIARETGTKIAVVRDGVLILEDP